MVFINVIILNISTLAHHPKMPPPPWWHPKGVPGKYTITWVFLLRGRPESMKREVGHSTGRDMNFILKWSWFSFACGLVIIRLWDLAVWTILLIESSTDRRHDVWLVNYGHMIIFHICSQCYSFSMLPVSHRKMTFGISESLDKKKYFENSFDLQKTLNDCKIL